VGGTLFFGAKDGTHGRELWRSNGTAAGTVLVKDIRPGGGESFPKYLTNVNGALFFQADDGTHGPELWESNGTAAGTVLVEDIFPGNVGSLPSFLTNVNGTLFFAANDGVHGDEPWVLGPLPVGGTAAAWSPVSAGAGPLLVVSASSPNGDVVSSSSQSNGVAETTDLVHLIAIGPLAQALDMTDGAKLVAFPLRKFRALLPSPPSSGGEGRVTGETCELETALGPSAGQGADGYRLHSALDDEEALPVVPDARGFIPNAFPRTGKSMHGRPGR
jgi:ELWxxDGT repeat protein